MYHLNLPDPPPRPLNEDDYNILQYARKRLADNSRLRSRDPDTDEHCLQLIRLVAGPGPVWTKAPGSRKFSRHFRTEIASCESCRCCFARRESPTVTSAERFMLRDIVNNLRDCLTSGMPRWTELNELIDADIRERLRYIAGPGVVAPRTKFRACDCPCRGVSLEQDKEVMEITELFPSKEFSQLDDIAPFGWQVEESVLWLPHCMVAVHQIVGHDEMKMQEKKRTPTPVWRSRTKGRLWWRIMKGKAVLSNFWKKMRKNLLWKVRKAVVIVKEHRAKLSKERLKMARAWRTFRRPRGMLLDFWRSLMEVPRRRFDTLTCSVFYEGGSRRVMIGFERAL